MIAGRDLGRLAASLGLATQVGCFDPGRLDLELIADAAFPAAVPGLPADRPWTSFPVATWVVDGGLTVQAIAACFPPTCAPPAAVALLRARGPPAAELALALDEPKRLERYLRTRMQARLLPGRADTAALITVEPRREGAWPGFAVRMARRDGTRTAAGFVLARRDPTGLTLVLVIAADEDSAARLARSVAPALG